MSAGRRWLRAVSDTQWKLSISDVSATGTLPNPTVSFALSVTGGAVHVDGSGSFSTNGPITGYLWDFGDGSTATTAAADHTYTATGSYSVRLSLTDSLGRTSSYAKTAVITTIAVAPVATAALVVSSDGLTATLDASGSTVSSGSITGYRFSFGDGSAAVSSTGPIVVHSYAGSGSYSCTVSITTSVNAPGSASATAKVSTSPTGGGAGGTLPTWDHIVYVWMENEAESAIIGSASAPYINALANAGALFPNALAEDHPSQPNYLAGFSGSTQGVSDDNNHDLGALPNLFSQLKSAGLSFTGYVESPGVRKHSPWESFSNTSGAEADFSTFPTNYALLPSVAWVVPNLMDDMHDGTIAQGDSWLKTHIDPVVTWAKANNSLVIVVWDENDYSTTHGNNVPMIFAGAHVNQGKFTRAITHYDVLGLIQDAHGLPRLNSTVGLQPLADPFTTSSWNLLWGDEFGGSAVDTSSWNVDNGTTYGSGNNELELNMAANATVANSMLTVTAKKQTVTAGGVTRNYTSAHLSTKGKREFTIGPNRPLRVEVRAQLPDVTHLLPCPAWLRPSDGGNGEVDLVEATGTTDTDNAANTRISQTVHLSYSPGLQNAIVSYLDSSHGFSGSNGVKDWHVYAVEVFSDHVTYYVDGKTIGTVTASSSQMNSSPNFASVFGVARSWFLHVTLGVGGNWPGTPTAATTFPAPMNIDWIRVYTK